jgi:hypothetical protein
MLFTAWRRSAAGGSPTPQRLRRAGLLAAFACAALVMSLPASALAARGNGLNGVLQNGGAGTGYGPGWVALSITPNDPIVGYLFASDNQANGDRDYMDIFNAQSGACGGLCTYPRGFAGGQFYGCAYAYTFDAFYQAGGHVVGECTPPALSQQQLFCTGGDPLCSPDGAYTSSRAATVVNPPGGACYAVANLTSAAFTGSASSHGTPKNLLAWVGQAPEAVAVRYVTKDRQFVLLKFNNGRVFSAYPDLRWVFVPRVCVQV